MEGKLFKKGTVVREEDGSLFLVNEDHNRYKVNQTIFALWDICEGISFNALVDHIASGTKEDVNTVRTSLNEILTQMKKDKLIEAK